MFSVINAVSSFIARGSCSSTFRDTMIPAGVICRRAKFEVASLFGSPGRRRPCCRLARTSAIRLVIITPTNPTRVSASPRPQRFAASALQTGSLGNSESFQSPAPAESKDLAIDPKDESGVPCIASRRGIVAVIGAASAAVCGATVGPPPGLAAENTSVLVGIQRYRQRQYVAEQGRLSDEEVLEALMGWQLALDMVEAAALRGDTIYLRFALTTGVLDFPTLDAAMDVLTNPDGGSAAARTALSKERAEGWREAVQGLKKSVLEQLQPGGSPREIARQIAVSRDALELIREAIEGSDHPSALPP